MRGDLVVHPPLVVDRTAGVPLTHQVVTGMRRLVESGALQAGDRLPSTRALAASLGLARGTVVTAYEQLEAEGYLVSAHGSGTRVAHLGPAPRTPAPSGPAPWPAAGHAREDGLLDLRPGHPDISTIDSPPWRRAWREALARPEASDDPAGLEALRVEVAEHLRLMRSLIRPPDQLLVTAGTREGLALVLGALAQVRGAGQLRVGVERPGHPALSGIPAALGHRVLALAADTGGLVTDALPDAAGLDAVIVTPNHQYPYGGVLAARRRRELLDWARQGRVLLVEDDYDSELRYVGMPLPSLAALDDPQDGCVATLGTFSTVLSPALATGYLAAPAGLLDPLLERRRALGLPSGAIVQQALAGYLASGELRRHIQRMRRSYRARRLTVTEALADVPGARLAPLTGGLQAVVLTEAPGARVVAAARARGVLVGDLAGHWGEPGDQQGIVFGFAGLPEPRLAEALRAVTASCAAPPGPRGDCRDDEERPAEEPGTPQEGDYP